VKRLLLATRNEGKVRELRQLLGAQSCHLETLATHPEVGEVEETGKTFDENARLKASRSARDSGLWTVAEDSGLVVDVLGGEPGVRSARYAGVHGDDQANIRKLLQSLQDEPDRAARFICVTALASPDGEVVATTQGTCEGSISLEPRGESGFGYDPCFEPEGETRTNAELTAREKGAISHRGRAIRALVPLLHFFLDGEGEGQLR
jgi:XTP/dITP diphosphohydrolase